MRSFNLHNTGSASFNQVSDSFFAEIHPSTLFNLQSSFKIQEQFAFIMANIKGNHVHNIGSPNRQSVYQSYHSIQSEHMHSHVCFPAMLETTAAVHPGASGGAVLKRLHTRQFKYSFCLIGHMIEHLIFLYSLVV
ncbi:hypothetical protein P8452_37755 [Trifolium repens]|nr:hypothetical protein P8452_37755 [Trifolium repens]